MKGDVEGTRQLEERVVVGGEGGWPPTCGIRILEEENNEGPSRWAQGVKGTQLTIWPSQEMR